MSKKQTDLAGRLSRRSMIVRSAITGTALAGAVRFCASQSADAQDAVTGALSGNANQLGQASDRISFDAPKSSTWKVGLVLDTPVTCLNVLATFPLPVNWPEQTVTVKNQVVDPRIKAWKIRDLSAGAKQVVLQIPQVASGTSAEFTFELDITRSRILPPQKTDDLVIPKRVKRDLQIFLGKSPHIDLSDGRIRKVSRELAAKDAENDWQRIEQIYDFVREKVQYVEGKLKNASDALKDGTGDCEELTSLFVALCRNAKVPARMVWIPGHCYPEFYLEDGEGKGHWFPCQAAGTRQFGRMDEYRPVLQKGDRFKVPEKRTPVRYVAEFFKCDRRGSGSPRPNFVREQIDV